MSFNQNEWGQREIINKITIWTKKGKYMINAIITMKYQKYPSTTIPKHENVLAKVNKSTYGRLINMTPHDAFSITLHVHAMAISYISHTKKE